MHKLLLAWSEWRDGILGWLGWSYLYISHYTRETIFFGTWMLSTLIVVFSLSKAGQAVTLTLKPSQKPNCIHNFLHACSALLISKWPSYYLISTIFSALLFLVLRSPRCLRLSQHCLILNDSLVSFLLLIDSAGPIQLLILYALWFSMSLRLQIKDSLPGPMQTGTIPSLSVRGAGLDRSTHLLSGK